MEPDRRAVSGDDIEALLAEIARRTPNPLTGIFGPESITWRINRESALFLGAGRAALLQLTHPWVMAALDEHSRLLEQPIVRFHNTFRIVFTMVFGTLDQALGASRHLYELHTHIRGQLREDTAGWRRGDQYEANEIGALRWVYSTLVESAVIAYEYALGPLPRGAREQYYTESKTMAALFGLPSRALPDNWEDFLAYNDRMHGSDVLGVSSQARAYAARLLTGAGSSIRPPRWYRALTAAWLPPRFRQEFLVDFGPAELRQAEGAVRRLARIYRRLPGVLRWIGPFHEAQARLRLRPAGLLTRLSNRFWMGQELLPFA
jgi:uncharacterized protein (DUF2236 family)